MQLDKEQTKMVILLRGLPGSGKSELAQKIRSYFLSKELKVSLLSIDKWFEYIEYSKEGYNGAARTLKMQLGNTILLNVNVIIIDMNNISIYEYHPFKELAEQKGYVVFQEVVDHKTTQECFDDTRHQIAYEELELMARSFYKDEDLPILSQQFNYRG